MASEKKEFADMAFQVGEKHVLDIYYKAQSQPGCLSVFFPHISVASKDSLWLLH